MLTRDFVAHKHPVLAVACSSCGAAAGASCKRPSGHRANDFHADRKKEADAAFIAQHGPDAWIERLPPGDRWKIHPKGYAAQKSR